MSTATVTFELKNGKTLKCVYDYSYWPGNYDNPPEYDPGEPSYYLDEKKLQSTDELPKGLDVIAMEMYEDSENSKFSYDTQESLDRYEDDGYDGY